MQRSEMDPDEGGPGGSPRTSDRPPVGEPLVVSKRRPVQPAAEPEPPAPPPGPLAGRVGLVTGATGDLGSAFAGALGERGARVCLLDADLDALRSSAARVGAGDPPLVLRCDLGSADDVRSVCDFLRRSGARLDLVVHAATAPQDGTVLDSPVDGLDEHYLIEVRAPSILAQELADSLAPGASVVFVDREPDHADVGPVPNGPCWPRRAAAWWTCCGPSWAMGTYGWCRRPVPVTASRRTWPRWSWTRCSGPDRGA